MNVVEGGACWELDMFSLCVKHNRVKRARPWWKWYRFGACVHTERMTRVKSFVLI